MFCPKTIRIIYDYIVIHIQLSIYNLLDKCSNGRRCDVNCPHLSPYDNLDEVNDKTE